MTFLRSGALSDCCLSFRSRVSRPVILSILVLVVLTRVVTVDWFGTMGPLCKGRGGGGWVLIGALVVVVVVVGGGVIGAFVIGLLVVVVVVVVVVGLVGLGVVFFSCRSAIWSLICCCCC